MYEKIKPDRERKFHVAGWLFSQQKMNEGMRAIHVLAGIGCEHEAPGTCGCDIRDIKLPGRMTAGTGDCSPDRCGTRRSPFRTGIA